MLQRNKTRDPPGVDFTHVTRVLEMPRFASRPHKTRLCDNEHFLERDKVSIIEMKQYPWDTQRER